MNQIYQGTLWSPCREYVAKAVVTATVSFDRVFVPCTGRFSAVTALIDAGVKPDLIYASDIGLFSSIIGYLADPDRELRQLSFEIPDDLARFIDPVADMGDTDWAAGLLVALKFAKTKARNPFETNLKREIWRNAHVYRDHIASDLKALLGRIAGIHYDVADLWDVVEDVKAGDFLLLNPPAYKGGYSAMFGDAEQRFGWYDTVKREFDPADMWQLLSKLTDSECATLAYVVGKGSDVPETKVPEAWSTFYGEQVVAGGGPVEGTKPKGEDAGDRVDYLVGNPAAQQVIAYTFAEPRISRAAIRHFEIYNEQEITPESEIAFMQVDKATALYYRDLFVHRLGAVDGHVFFLMFIDGRVCASTSIHTQRFWLGQSDDFSMVFGVSITSTRYDKLNKLFMLCMTSGAMKALLLHKYRSYALREPKGIFTTSIAQHEENKNNRGVMKLIRREQMGEGLWKLFYRADWRTADMRFEDCLRRWIDKGWNTSKGEKIGEAITGTGAGA